MSQFISILLLTVIGNFFQFGAIMYNDVIDFFLGGGETSIILISKTKKKIIRKEYYRKIFIISIGVKALNKVVLVVH